MSTEDVGSHFRLWVRAGMTGCEFAKRLAGKADQVAIAVRLEEGAPPAGWFESLLDPNADADRAVIAVFPLIANEASLVELLNDLPRERWRVRRRLNPSPTGNVLVGMDWTTSQGDVSEAMGFAPFLSMPVPRRAPYVAIAMWPGGRANPFRGRSPTPTGRPGVVSFLDAKHDLAEADYNARWQQTSDQIATLMSVPPDDARLYRTTAFVISTGAADRLVVDR